MKKPLFNLLLITVLFFTNHLYAQQLRINKDDVRPVALEKSEKPLTRRSQMQVKDPLEAIIHTLPNGLKIYMTVFKDQPRVYASIAVRAGSKHDPAETTGLAHYFEHMMFKGTPNFGTMNYEEEAVYIAKIDSLFEIYRTLTNEKERRELFAVIDSISFIASKLAIPNEYDKLMQIIGSSNTNAYTSLEQTVYIEDIPSNQLENWAIIQADRFTKPVLRLFHTELETIYEEKNMTLTSDNRKVFTATLEGLFPTHPYGTQTTIGTQEHLKNPSMTNINRFFDEYYVPNNMAICLSGDFDPDEAIRIIETHFGQFAYRAVPEFAFKPAPAIEKPIVKEVWGPDAESVSIAFRFDGAKSYDALILMMIDKILNNGTAGLIDLDLIQKQKVLEAYSYNMILEDYSVFYLAGKPKSGQSLDELKELLLQQLEKIKKGQFDEWLLEAIINDLRLQEIRRFENNSSRAAAFVDAFVLGVPWDVYISRIDRLSRISKDEIVAFVNKHFSDNYVITYKRTGRDASIQRIPKNKVTPVAINRDAESDFLMKIRDMQQSEIEPAFLNFETDISHLSVKNIPVYYVQNNNNETFQLYYVFDMGTQHNQQLGVALEYLEYLGTSKYTPQELKQEFYKIGCSFRVFTSQDQVYVSLSGLSSNLPAGIKLFEHLLADAKPEDEAWKNYIDDIMQKRTDAKKNIQFIFSNLVAYGIYGKHNPGTYKLTQKQLKKISPEQMVDIIKSLNSYKHRVLFYGSINEKELASILETHHNVPAQLLDYPTKNDFIEQSTDKKQVYYIDFDTPQTMLLLISKGQTGYQKELTPVIRLYNDYFGMNMNSIVFQEMREARGLAYAAVSFYQEPSKQERSYYNISYIATQYDKVDEAISGFKELINQFPESQQAFDVAKESVIQGIRTERITGRDILFTYEQAKELGLKEDIRKAVYKNVQSYEFDDIRRFQQENLKGKNSIILVLGNKNDIPPKHFKKYGKVKVLKLQNIFGY